LPSLDAPFPSITESPNSLTQPFASLLQPFASSLHPFPRRFHTLRIGKESAPLADGAGTLKIVPSRVELPTGNLDWRWGIVQLAQTNLDAAA
jgi:hypothetical protein